MFRRRRSSTADGAARELSARSAVVVAVLLALALLSAAQKVAKSDALESLVARWFAADSRSPAGAAERAQIQAQLDTLIGVLGPKEVAEWSKKVLAHAAQGTKLEKSAGEHWLE